MLFIFVSGLSPRKLGTKRNTTNDRLPELTSRVPIPASIYWFGSQIPSVQETLYPGTINDGAKKPRLKVSVKFVQFIKFYSMHSTFN